MSAGRDIPWAPRPNAPAVGTRPTPKGVDLMIGVPDAPTLIIPLSLRETREFKRALSQALRDHQLGVFATTRPEP